MRQLSKFRDSRKVERYILDVLKDGESLSKPELRSHLSLYGQKIVNSTVKMLQSQRVLVELDDGKLALNKDIREV